jgi:hypothetical protein
VHQSAELLRSLALTFPRPVATTRLFAAASAEALYASSAENKSVAHGLGAPGSSNKAPPQFLTHGHKVTHGKEQNQDNTLH